MWPPSVRGPWRTNARRSGGESDVGHPHLVHAIGRDVATDKILGGLAPQRVNGGGHRPAPSADARDRGLAHQRRSPLAARMTPGTQCGMDARRAVGAMGDGMNGADTAKRAASRLCRADWGGEPRMEAGSRDTRHASHYADGMNGAVRPHRLIRPFGTSFCGPGRSLCRYVPLLPKLAPLTAQAARLPAPGRCHDIGARAVVGISPADPSRARCGGRLERARQSLTRAAGSDGIDCPTDKRGENGMGTSVETFTVPTEAGQRQGAGAGWPSGIAVNEPAVEGWKDPGPGSRGCARALAGIEVRWQRRRRTVPGVRTVGPGRPADRAGEEVAAVEDPGTARQCLRPSRPSRVETSRT